MSSLDLRHSGPHDLIAPDTPVDRIAGGLVFTEGPVWRGDTLLFSDIPNNRIARWRRLPEGPELATFATGYSNGLTLDHGGHIVAAGTPAVVAGSAVSRTAPYLARFLGTPGQEAAEGDGARASGQLAMV